VDESLRLPRGKLAAQVGHAAVSAFLGANPDSQQKWLDEGMPKVVLRAASEEQLLDLHHKARTAGISSYLVRDAGHTVIDPGTATCVGIGPAESEELEPITGELKLVR